MKKFLLAAIVVTMVATGATAQQDPYVSYSLPLDGGCGFVAISDGTDSPQTAWEGEVHAIAVAARQAGIPVTEWIEVECELRINGAQPGTVVFWKGGLGVAAGAAQLRYHADPDDVIAMCTHVSTRPPEYCNDATTRPIVPGPVAEAIDEAKWLIDDATCEPLGAMAWADQPPAFDIRSDGDIYVGGQLIWDCQPYGTSGS